MSRRRLSKNLSQPEAIPPEGIDRATQMMRDGRLFRYGEAASEELEVSRFEQEFADYLGLPFVCGVNSGGCALFLALKAVGVKPGDKVLVNAFTLAPVPGAIDHAAAVPVLVDITEDYVIDLSDLKRKAAQHPGCVLLLSHMRGHIADMDAVLAICQEYQLILIEDCAHTLGARWGGRFSGTFGTVGCFSTQTFKHLNSGEGGLLASRDEDTAAKIVLYSGSYMLFEQNGAKPSVQVFDRWKGQIPNYSMRMSALVAAILRPQLPLLAERAALWNERYAWLCEGLRVLPGLRLPQRLKQDFVASSIQFSLLGRSAAQLEQFQQGCEARGVLLKWFGHQHAQGFTSQHRHWGYIHQSAPLRATDEVMKGLFDMRIPLSLSQQDCQLITSIIAEELQETA